MMRRRANCLRMNVRIVILEYHSIRISGIPWKQLLLKPGADDEFDRRGKRGRITGMVRVPVAARVETTVSKAAIAVIPSFLPPNNTVNLAECYMAILL